MSAGVQPMPIGCRCFVTAIVLAVAAGCREPVPHRAVTSEIVDAGVRSSGSASARTVVKGSQQPKCQADTDCPPHHGCACTDGGCIFLPVSDADPGEPSAGFCIPLPTLWGGELPPGVKDR